MRIAAAGAVGVLAAVGLAFAVAPGVSATPRRPRGGRAPVGRPASGLPGRPAPTLAANRAAAHADAPELLAALRLPSGATRLPAEPAGDHGFLKATPALNPTSAHAVVHAWWRVSGDAAGVLAYVRAHAPAGARPGGTGEIIDTHTGASARTLDYDWPPIAGVLGERELAVTVMTLPGGVAGVLAEAESDWIVPRPASERIPSAVREIDIAVAKPDQPAGAPRSVTSRARVRRIVALFNAMPITQPAWYSCPAEMLSGSRRLTFTFRARVGGPALARATYADYRPLNAPSGPCTPIQLTIGGRAQDGLIGGYFIRRIDRMLDANLFTGVR
ncbi:MAG TPA: hypothetical protein VHX62_01280 [Solirubrobacteraceae bacterium]|nr:hypothetical protein [Solirubrobacteraceae bacterium]